MTSTQARRVKRVKHGLRKHPLYRTWANIKTRCYNSKTHNFDSYGGKGIAMCEEWRVNFKSFYDWSMSNGYRPDLTIDRIDNEKDYSPSNCRWIPSKEQARNKTSNHLITLGHSTKCLVEWCEIFGLKYNTVEQRINEYGWSEKEALLTPVKRGDAK